MKGGFISTIILLIVALALLKYFFDWSIFDAASSDQGQKTVEYIKDVITLSWSYIKLPLTWLWEKILFFRQSR